MQLPVPPQWLRLRLVLFLLELRCSTGIPVVFRSANIDHVQPAGEVSHEQRDLLER
jgi:hypothetical protein